MSFFTPFAFVKQASAGGVTPGLFIQATGGTVTTDGDFKIHSFTTAGSGSFVIAALGTDATYGNKVQYLIIGGGGSGGSAGFSEFGAGGGGAGGKVNNAAVDHTVTAQTYSIVVGAGGVKVAAGRNAGNDGKNSQFDTFTSIGGGGGGSSNGGAGRDGGSGGGSGGLNSATTKGLGTAGQGNNGGEVQSTGDPYGGSGGGGASADGGNGTGNGIGGNGAANSITGTSVTYAGGGSGGETFAPAFVAGTGGGGTGGVLSTSGTDGTDGLGGGGGGGGNDGSGSGTQGGDGGDGIVVIRYKFQNPTARYWRYQVATTISSHHPRVSRVDLIDENNVIHNIVSYVADNCSDSGTIPGGAPPSLPSNIDKDFGFGNSVAAVNAQFYNTYDGGTRASGIIVYYSTDGTNYTQAFTGTASSALLPAPLSCGLHTIL